jgi:phage host-nuclease inhibitor protein Gam
MADYEKLGLFYLGRTVDSDKKAKAEYLLYDSRDLVTHAVCVGMTGSGKTGLCIDLLEEAAIDGVPALVIDPKGDLGNLLLTFPNLAASDFRPWIDEDEARRNGKSPDEWAAAQADLWKKGLASWDQDGDRIKRLKEAADFTIYTPGSQSGLPLSIIKSFAAPSADFMGEADLMRERVATTATSLLGLLGIDADPIKSREHILLSTLIDATWRKGQDLDLAALIQLIQKPPVARIGVMDLDAFFPADKRFELAMSINNLLAAPGFSAWMDGEPLDVQRLLYTAKGQPRVSILSIAHLNDAERMFFVSLLLNQVLGWMRQQPGTTSLRALVYMDEIAGYLPPVANPASKAPMLTLLKQARAFGVGMVLATQNPVDLDYKALSNAGTWFIGRLQTERDQARVLDGLEGAMSTAGGPFDRNAMGKIISGVSKRQFLLHNVHEDHPEVFESRWAMSYLRGPLTRTQIKTLMAGRTPDSGLQTPGMTAARSPQPVASEARSPKSEVASSAPVVPPGITQYFAPAKAGATYTPVVAGAADIRFTDTKSGIDATKSVVFVTPITDEAIPVNWDQAEEASFDAGQLSSDLPAGATFDELPGAATKAKNYGDWQKAFTAWLSASQVLTTYRSPSLGVTSNGTESEGDFRARLMQKAREKRDDDVAALRQKYAPKLAALQERLRRAQQSVEKEKAQASAQWVQSGLQIGATVLGAFLGRKTFSTTNMGKAATAARGMGRAYEQSSDVGRAQENSSSVQAQIDELNTSLQSEIAALDVTYNPQAEKLDTVTIKPKRTGIQVKLVALTWVGR